MMGRGILPLPFIFANNNYTLRLAMTKAEMRQDILLCRILLFFIYASY